MKLARHLLSVAALFALSTGAASAVPIIFQLDSVTAVGAAFPSSQTYTPGLPLVGSGDIDFGAGTGFVTLPDYSIVIDVSLDGDDAQIDVTNWMQTITSIDGSGNIVSVGSGSSICTVLGGIGAFVCPGIAPTIPGWPPADGPSLVSSAVIDTGLQTITVIDNSLPAGGEITSVYSYTIVPEPSTALLVMGGLIALGGVRRR